MTCIRLEATAGSIGMAPRVVLVQEDAPVRPQRSILAPVYPGDDTRGYFQIPNEILSGHLSTFRKPFCATKKKHLCIVCHSTFQAYVGRQQTPLQLPAAKRIFSEYGLSVLEPISNRGLLRNQSTVKKM